MTTLASTIDNLDPADHEATNYFSLLKEAVAKRQQEPEQASFWQQKIDQIYRLLEDEIRSRRKPPQAAIKFGTSGWRGMLGKDINVFTVTIVTQAIIAMYEELAQDTSLAADLGVSSLAEAQQKGAVIGHDNRFAGAIFAQTASDLLTAAGFTVHQAWEATTGSLSAAVMELGAAFSINITPSHNPLEYAGFKFNAADGGPAAPLLTNRITSLARELISQPLATPGQAKAELVKDCDALALWFKRLEGGKERHGLNFSQALSSLNDRDFVLAVDCVHGASRVHIDRLLTGLDDSKIIRLRTNADPTFAGLAPEPSDANMQPVLTALASRSEALKLGVVMDPDGDRIRFCDGQQIINMNGFGALAYHFLHEELDKKGLVAKTVATSNMANALAHAFGEEVYEPRVGFKEFKPVLDKALVCFEESDGITVLGHTAEKDAYIGLVLALAMIDQRGQNLGPYFQQVAEQYGHYFPAKDGVTVSQQGEELLATLAQLEKYQAGGTVRVGGQSKEISQVIAIDGLKLVFADKSWLLIRPSGTEPKVRFYVEARSEAGMEELFTTAKEMLAEIGL